MSGDQHGPTKLHVTSTNLYPTKRLLREMGAIYFKRRKHRLTDKDLVMLCIDCVSHSMLDQAGKLFMCDETVR